MRNPFRSRRRRVEVVVRVIFEREVLEQSIDGGNVEKTVREALTRRRVWTEERAFSFGWKLRFDQTAAEFFEEGIYDATHQTWIPPGQVLGVELVSGSDGDWE